MMVEMDEVKEVLREYGVKFWEKAKVEVIIQDMEEQLGRRRTVHRVNEGQQEVGGSVLGKP